MSKHHRFTGRELTSLLEQVREELGAEATILEANKVRTGGIAGFFANEKFEVIATPSADDEMIDLDDRIGVQLDLDQPRIATGVAQQLVASADERDTVDIRTSTLTSERPSTGERSASQPTATTTTPDPAAVTSLLERVETISLRDRIGLSQPAPSTSTKPAPPPESRFGDILASELQQPEISIRTSATEDFWTHLDELESELEPLDLESQIVTIVGNQAAALSVAGTIEETADGETRALVAVTPPSADATAHGAAELPAWQQVGNEIELGDRLRFWQNSERHGTVLIDADFGADALTLVERVRAAGSRVVRIAVDDELTPKRIFDLMARLGGNVVIDLTFRAEPSYVLSLVDRGVPLASVDGHRFDANLLLALNREVQHG